MRRSLQRVGFDVVVRVTQRVGCKEDKASKDDDEKPRREEIMKTLLTNLNESEGRDAWTGKADVHYIFIWSTDVLQC